MLRLALAQMRRSPGRLAAGGVAIGLGSAFVAVTLLAGGVMTRTTYDAVTASYARADLVLEGWGMTDADAAALSRVPGVRAVEPRMSTFVELRGPSGALWLEVTAPAADPDLEAQVLVEGVLPGPGEIALPQSVATNLGVELGGMAGTTVTRLVSDDGAMEPLVSDLTVVGVLDSSAAGLVGPPVALAAQPQVREWITYQAPGEEPVSSLDLVSLDDAADPVEAKAAVRRSLAATNPLAGEITVRTLDEQAEWIIADLTKQAQTLTTIALGFAAIALLVAALVIGNTFQVLVAQRTRTLALLRCVGADRSQLRRSVIIEALLLGTAASTAGVLLGTGVVQVALLVLGRTASDVPLPTTVQLTAASVVVPLAVGVGVTVVAALAPARAATRVSPLAALRPSDAPRVGDRAGRVRAWLSALLIVGGALGMAAGVGLATRSDLTGGLGLGVLGGAVSFVGVLLSAVFWAPRLVALVARLVSRGGPATRLAGANSVRNPRRTAATSTALLIGVTLVMMMATGAASARVALDNRLNAEFPVDVEVRAMDEWAGAGQLSPQLVGTTQQTDGVAAVVRLMTGLVDLSGLPYDSVWGPVTALGVDQADGGRALRSPDQLGGLRDDTVIVPQQLADWTGIEDGDVVTLRPTTWAEASPDGTVPGKPTRTHPPVSLTAVIAPLAGDSPVLTRATLAALGVPQVESRLWVRLEAGADAREVVGAIESAASRSTPAVLVTGAATERASYQQVIDTLLAIVVGLLAVSVVIALVGVANTLSLSVIERRRESATLRALGLTRGQLRGSLAAEGMIIAGVGAVAGTVLGIAYGWVGARTALTAVGTAPLAIPWREVVVVTVVALGAGLAASVLPARSAVRTSPVESLAVE